MTRLIVLATILFATVLLAGCKDMPGWDGRYAVDDHGNGNRENRGGLPVTPYVPH